MKSRLRNLALLLTVFSLTFTACEDTGNKGPAPIEALIAENVPANINTIFATPDSVSNIEGNTENSPGYTFYDLDLGTTVQDSLSADWDIAFGETTILANSGNGGGIQLLDQTYASVETAPTSGFEDSNSNWYTYTGEAPNGPQHAIIANDHQTLVILTPDGKYAKVQILSYYEDDPDTDSPEFANFMTRPASKYFTFNYTIQNDGSAQLYHEDRFTFYDLDEAEIVEDSLSSQWDLGFNATTIIANSGNNGGVQILNIAFADLDEAPIEGYTALNTSWYTYTGEAPSGPKHAILPNDGQTLVVQTPGGKYAKVRIISYYQGNPDVNSQNFINFIRPASRYYTFEYAVQTDGSRFFE